MAVKWNGFEDGDVTLNFKGGAIFNVHRGVVAEASPVWNAMLNGQFAESKSDTIVFTGDDHPEIARLCIELIYSTRAESSLDWTSIRRRVVAHRGAFDAFVDKHDLRGVKRLVADVLRVEMENQQLKNNIQQLKNDIQQLQNSNNDIQQLKNSNQLLNNYNQRLNGQHQQDVQRVHRLGAEVAKLKRRRSKRLRVLRKFL